MALIHVVESMGDADVLACEASSRQVADLLVHLVEEPRAAIGDALWYYVEAGATATSRVCFIDLPGQAHLLVYFVESRGVAGWQTAHHPLEGAL